MTKPNRMRGNIKTTNPRPADKAVKPALPGTDNTSGGALLGAAGLAELRRLIRLLQRTGIGELEVSSGDRTVRIAAQSHLAANVGLSPAAAFVPALERPAATAVGPAAAAPQVTENLAAITSPMVGTFYLAPAPDADPYVESGDMVEVGQTVCIIEAMKLMNEIESEHRGRVVKILVENAQPVEFGQKLFLIEPA